MIEFTELGQQNLELPEGWESFFYAKFKPELCSTQDATHIAVKLARRLIKTLFLGEFVISSSIIKDVIKSFPKSIHLLTVSDFDTKDKMTFKTVQKLLHPGVEKCLKECEDSEGMLIYIKLIRCVNEAYIDYNCDPDTRIRRAWWIVFFIRYWRKDLLRRGQEVGGSSNLKQKSTSLKNFITTNTYSGLEVNAHNMLNHLVKCRDMGMPHLFLLALQSSQTCEGYFRRTRSMTSTFSTVINFTVYDLLHRAKRSQAISEIMNELGETYVFPRDEVTPRHMVPDSLPDNAYIKNLVFQSLEEAIEDLESIGNH
jgi:hypothetical protein